MSSEGEGLSSQDEVEFIRVVPSTGVECVDILDDDQPADEASSSQNDIECLTKSPDVIEQGEIFIIDSAPNVVPSDEPLAEPLVETGKGESAPPDEVVGEVPASKESEGPDRTIDKDSEVVIINEVSHSTHSNPPPNKGDGTCLPENEPAKEVPTSQEGGEEEEGEIATIQDVENCSFIIIDEVGDADESGECKEGDEPSVVFSADESGLFCFDTTPQNSKDRPLGPRFRREFDATLTYETEVVESAEDSGSKMDNRCFNCLGDHTIANCPEPRNPREIAKNRAVFLKNQPMRNLNRRYHVDQQSKFGEFKPGVISDKLRDALGLRKSEIPFHIYQMRILGYPPGWVENIKQHSSGLDFIDSPNASSSEEEGQTMTYDVDRLISYPGFNVPLDPSIRDDWRRLNFPPMRTQQSKEVMMDFLRNINRKEPLRKRSGSKKKEPITITDVIDMDTSDEDASLDALEEARKALMAKLNEEAAEDDESNSAEVVSEAPGNEPTSAQDSDAKECEPNPTTSTEEPETVDAPKPSRLLAMGTPVAIRHSPFNALPTIDKFASNMGDLELYQNLPNSTGTYQKMRSLLQKVRTTLKKD